MIEIAAILPIYLSVGLLLTLIAKKVATMFHPLWWADDRKRRAFLLSWFLAWPIAIVVLVAWKVPPMFKRFLWDE